MLDRIFSYSSSSSTSSDKYVDCFQCRMIGGGGLVGLGGYILYYSFIRRNHPSLNKLTLLTSSFLGSVVMTLGTMRLLGMHELKNELLKQQELQTISKQQELGEDPELLKDH